MRRLTGVGLIAVAALILARAPVPAGAAHGWPTASEISNAVLQGDGIRVYLRLEDIIKIKNNPAYIVIAEPFSRKDRLICLTDPSPELRLEQVVDVEGDLTTLPNGARALQNVTVWGYASELGVLLYRPSIIKQFPESAAWPWSKIDLTVRPTATLGAPSAASVSSNEPNSDPAEGPTYYPRIGDTPNSGSFQAQSIRAQSYYPGIPNLQGLAAGSLVELECKRITAVGTETINGTVYKYLDMAEDLPSTDAIRCYYEDGAPTTESRINKISGQIRYTNGGSTEVICIDDGPDYNRQILEGELKLVSPNTVAFVRTQANGASASLTGKVVTANQTDFPGTLYNQRQWQSVDIIYGRSTRQRKCGRSGIPAESCLRRGVHRHRVHKSAVDRSAVRNGRQCVGLLQ